MRGGSLVTKIVLSACGVIALLLIAAGILVISFELRLVQTFVRDYTAGQNRALETRATLGMKNLHDETALDTKILSGISATHLYNVDAEAMQYALRSFMDYPRILAIQIVDEDRLPFAAAWRDPGVHTGERLPEALVGDQHRVTEMEAVHNDLPVGNVQVYYTDRFVREELDQAKTEMETALRAFQNKARASLNQIILYQSVGIVIILVILVAALRLLLRAFVLKPIALVGQITRSLSDFDLTVAIPAVDRDEFGRLLHAISDMIQKFRAIIGQVQHSGIQVTSSTTELSATAKQQEATLRTQVEAIQSVAGATQDIAELAAHLVDTMREVAVMSGETAEFASHGQNDLTRMQDAMQQMETASRSISGRLQAINEKAENITTVVTTITKVADQTNLLSLNAAIEAEKAGEYGRGFTVVAREIRRLADQTAVATLDIDQMVKEMQSAVSAGVMEMDKFIADVRQSAADVENISEQLARIIEQVQMLSPRFEEVNVAMEDQSQHAREMNTTMLNLSEEMQQTRDSLHETYSAIEQLNDAARALGNQVSQFQVS